MQLRKHMSINYDYENKGMLINWSILTKYGTFVQNIFVNKARFLWLIAAFWFASSFVYCYRLLTTSTLTAFKVSGPVQLKSATHSK